MHTVHMRWMVITTVVAVGGCRAGHEVKPDRAMQEEQQHQAERLQREEASWAQHRQNVANCTVIVASETADPQVKAWCGNVLAYERARQENEAKDAQQRQQAAEAEAEASRKNWAAVSSALAGYNAEAARQERARQPRACSFNTDCDPGQVCAPIGTYRYDGACVAKR